MSNTIPEPADMARAFFEARGIEKADWNATGFADGVRVERSRALRSAAYLVHAAIREADGNTDPMKLARVAEKADGFARMADRLSGASSE